MTEHDGRHEPAHQPTGHPDGAHHVAGATNGAADGRVEHEIHSLRSLFRERRISLATMDRPLRLATGGALASLLAVVLLIALRDVKAPPVDVGRSGGIVVGVSLPLFIATMVLLATGFAYLLAGVSLASWPVAFCSVLLLTGAVGFETGSFGHVFGAAGFLAMLPHWAQWGSRLLLVSIWLVAGTAALINKRGPAAGSRARLRLSLIAVYAVIFGAYFAILRVASPSIGGLNNFPMIVSLLVEDIVLLVYPVLLVAAVDFGEWGGLVGERVAGGLRGRRSPALAGLAVLLSAGVAGYGYLNITVNHPLLSAARAGRAARMVLMLAIALLAVIAVGRLVGVSRRGWPATLGFASIFAVCALGNYLIAPVSAVLNHQFAGVSKPVEQVSAEGTFTGAADVISMRGGAGATGFSVFIPRGWLHRSVPGLDIWTNYAVPGAQPGAADPPYVRVGVGTVDLPVTATSSIPNAVSGTQRTDGPWLVTDIASPASTGMTWVQPDPAAPGTTYLLTELAHGVPEAAVHEQLAAIAHSFRPAGQPAATLPTLTEETPAAQAQQRSDRLQTVGLALSGAVLVLLLLAVATIGRRWPARLTATVLLLGMTTLATLVYFADSVGRTLLGAGTHWPYVSQFGLLTGIGLLELLGLAASTRLGAARRRRLVVGVVGLNTTIIALQVMSVVYSHALKASRISVWAAIIVLIAIGWDVTMSGESLTNHGTRHAPRETRVLAFLGYVILLAATVLFYSAQRSITSGAATEPFFEPESVTQAGLFRIALPLAVLMFLLRVFGRPPSSAPADRSPDPDLLSGDEFAPDRYDLTTADPAHVTRDRASL